ncbi:hypothetical protein [Pseudidiomarina insulisalsae]|uniref:Uncharacterized protein n=1 Tax=Pseudidiomarina insulisalsae TaxID=575789 RepID=A0A432YMQ4_9GAMM|nr:hypothetical protein [Pseudidiomarina insulisalsae]RUO62212.1 hypothetical protein CWI71_05010 [Pseudidiomarina insulisalsae]
MSPIYLVIQHSPQVAPVHYDYTDAQRAPNIDLMMHALTWVMRVKGATTLEKVQLWFQDETEMYLAERTALGSNIWLCEPREKSSAPNWQRFAIVTDATTAIEKYCEWRLNYHCSDLSHVDLTQLRESLDTATKQMTELNLHSKATQIGFFRHYGKLEQLHQAAIKAESATNHASRQVRFNGTMQKDIRTAMQQREAVRQYESKLITLRAEARSRFSRSKKDPKVLELHRAFMQTENEVANLRSSIDATIHRYHLHDVGIENTLKSLIRREKELATYEKQQQKAEQHFRVYRQWLRLHCAVQRTEELEEEHAHE